MKKLLLVFLLVSGIAYSQNGLALFPAGSSPDTTLFAARLGKDSLLVAQYTVPFKSILLTQMTIVSDTAMPFDVFFLANDKLTTMVNDSSLAGARVYGKVSVAFADFKIIAQNGKYVAFEQMAPGIVWKSLYGTGKMSVALVNRGGQRKNVNQRVLLLFGGTTW